MAKDPIKFKKLLEDIESGREKYSISCHYEEITDDDAIALAEALSKNKSITSIDLSSNKSLTVHGIAALAQNLHILSWNFNFCDDSIDDATVMFLLQNAEIMFLKIWGSKVTDSTLVQIAQHPSLKELDLGNCIHITSQGIIALTKNPRITKLNLGYNKILLDVCEGLSKNSSIIELDLSAAKIDDAGAMLIAQMSAIISVRLYNNDIGDNGFKALTDNQHIKSINLSKNKLSDEGIAYFAQTYHVITNLTLDDCQVSNVSANLLAKNSKIQYLSLNENPITTEAAIQIALARPGEYVSLRNCNINPKLFSAIFGEEGSSHVVAKSVLYKNFLQLYFQDKNKVNFSDFTIHMLLQQLIQDRNIPEVDLSNCSITQENMIALSEARHIRALNLSYNKLNKNDLLVLLQNTLAASLKLDQCDIDNDIITVLVQNSNITKVSLKDNKIAETGLLLLAQQCHISSLDLSNNKIGDSGAILLAKNQQFRRLILQNCDIGDSGTLALTNNTAIQELDLSLNPLTDETIIQFAFSPIVNDRCIHYQECNISPDLYSILHENGHLVNINQMRARGKNITPLLTKLISLYSHGSDTLKPNAEKVRFFLSSILQDLNSMDVDVSNTNLSQENIQLLAQASHVIRLDLSGNMLNHQTIIVLSNTTHIQELTLKNCMLSDKDMLILAQNTSIKKLDFRNNLMTDDMAIQIALLRSANQLYTVQLQDCGINSSIFDALCENDRWHYSLYDLPSIYANLIRLYLRGTDSIPQEREKAKIYLNQLMQESQKIVVDLSNCSIDDDMVNILIQNRYITSWNLSANNITDAGALILAGTTHIASLNVDGNQIGDQGRQALKNNTFIINLNAEHCAMGSNDYLELRQQQKIALSKDKNLMVPIGWLQQTISKDIATPIEESTIDYSSYPCIIALDARRTSLETTIAKYQDRCLELEENERKLSGGTRRHDEIRSYGTYSCDYNIELDYTFLFSYDERRVDLAVLLAQTQLRYSELEGAERALSGDTEIYDEGIADRWASYTSRRVPDLCRFPDENAYAMQQAFLNAERHPEKYKAEQWGNFLKNQTMSISKPEKATLKNWDGSPETVLQYDFFIREPRNRFYLGLYQEALSIIIHKESNMSLYQQAQVQLALNNHAEAIRLLDLLIKSNPKDSGAYLLRGQAYAASNLLDKALKDFDLILSLPAGIHYAEAYFERGKIYKVQENYDAAIADFNAAIKERAKDSQSAGFPLAHFELGLVKNLLDNPASALADFTQAIALSSRYAEAYFERGKTYLSIQNKILAEKDLQQAIRYKPDYAEAIAAVAALKESSSLDSELPMPALLPVLSATAPERDIQLHINNMQAIIASNPQIGRLESIEQQLTELSEVLAKKFEILDEETIQQFMSQSLMCQDMLIQSKATEYQRNEVRLLELERKAAEQAELEASIREEIRELREKQKLLLDEYWAEQVVKKQQVEIAEQPELRLCYLRLQTKLNTFFVGAQAVQSSWLQRSNTAAESVISGISGLASFISFIPGVDAIVTIASTIVGMYQDKKVEKQGRHISELTIGLARMEANIEKLSRKTVLFYRKGLLQLTPEGAGKIGEWMAKPVIAYLYRKETDSALAINDSVQEMFEAIKQVAPPTSSTKSEGIMQKIREWLGTDEEAPLKQGGSCSIKLFLSRGIPDRLGKIISSFDLETDRGENTKLAATQYDIGRVAQQLDSLQLQVNLMSSKVSRYTPEPVSPETSFSPISEQQGFGIFKKGPPLDKMFPQSTIAEAAEVPDKKGAEKPPVNKRSLGGMFAKKVNTDAKTAGKVANDKADLLPELMLY
jgi:hypothetical protein